jgi:hypothetical protein
MQMRSIIITAALLLALPAAADNLYVNSDADNGVDSLRWAIETANAAPGSNSIVFEKPVTIRLASPLPPVSGPVVFLTSWGGPGATIDGTNAGNTDGLVLKGDGSSIEALTVTNFRGDGIVLAGNHGYFRHMVLSGNRNGIQIRGNSNAVYGSWIANNRAAGVWVTASGSENIISTIEPTPDIFFPEPVPVVFPTNQADVIGGNGTGIVLDGNGNVVNGAAIGAAFNDGAGDIASANSGDGIIVNGTGNHIQNSRIMGNGGAGITLNAPAEVTKTRGCNSGPLIAGSQERPPELLSAIRDVSAMTIDGRLDAIPNTPYRIEVDSIDHECDSGVFSSDSVDVMTDEGGSSVFHFFSAITANRIVATATRIAKDVSATSPLSRPFDAVQKTTSSADFETTVTAPAVAPVGSTITIEIRVTNHGPAPASSVTINMHYPLSLVTLDATTTSGFCALGGINACFLGLLAPGETATIRHRVRIAQGETLRTYSAIVLLDGVTGLLDPVPSNNSATATVTVEAKTRAVRH